eukprot:TRINITY_DN56780_c0_g1_i1.p1 TRINITY_DN56780_c0_g1~~TRINITY_DN56780_c0_g1_i1.p1  ORF type:complete len:505 (+),score=79.35 TRINITY_DN56780_c0_g1_i1:42-1556(+)
MRFGTGMARWSGFTFMALACAHATKENACDLAVVGAGMGGAYAAWQASEAGKKVCVFELAARPGGRIHSLRRQGPKEDLVVEAGAYRFAPHEVCEVVGSASWCIYTPITAATVDKLGLKAGVYDPDPTQWDNKMNKLVDSEGHNIGYLTLPEVMLDRAASHGAKILYRTGVSALSGGDSSGVDLKLLNGETVHASAVLLNLPQAPLLRLLRRSGSPFADVFPAPLYEVGSFDIMKLYVHYEDAWWRNDLGLVAGPFANNNPPPVHNSHVIHPHDVPDQGPAPLKGQYHDGDVRCDGPKGKCRGYLQAYYSGGAAIDYYKAFHPFDGDSVVQLSPNTMEHKQLLAKIHSSLLQLHEKQLQAVNATARVARMMPDSGVLSIWSQGVEGIHGGCHSPMNGTNPLPQDMPKAALQPFAGLPVFVANEAYGPVPCFAEGSLNMSATALEHLGIAQPEWLVKHMADQAKVLHAHRLQGLGGHPPPKDPFLFMERSPEGRSSGLQADDLVV